MNMMQITVELQSVEDALTLCKIDKGSEHAIARVMLSHRFGLPPYAHEFIRDPEAASTIFLRLCASGLRARIEPEGGA
jgi:hypothetical protein